MKKYLLLMFSSILIFGCSSNISFIIDKTRYININSNSYNNLFMKIIFREFTLYNIVITDNYNGNIPELIIDNLTNNLTICHIDKNYINISLYVSIKLILSNRIICKVIKVSHTLIGSYDFICLEKIKNSLPLKYKLYQEIAEKLLLHIISYI
ncbi:MAG: hypothetical protein N4Q03_00500 [Candidatus Lightella neohaematopini]|nr:hypothetical protein [Candidatus Lightella neohaematopini]